MLKRANTLYTTYYYTTFKGSCTFGGQYNKMLRDRLTWNREACLRDNLWSSGRGFHRGGWACKSAVENDAETHKEECITHTAYTFLIYDPGIILQTCLDYWL